MGQNHTVAQGEYLSMIARSYGFADYLTIWNAPENQAIVSKRKNPNVLCPGDLLFIPDMDLGEITGGTNTKHRFELQTHPLTLRIKLMGLKKEPLVGRACVLTVDGDATPLKTKGNGMIEKPIPVTAAQGNLLDSGDPKAQVHIENKLSLLIGGLDPETEITGQIGRLNNLGYNAGAIPDHVLFPDEVLTLQTSQQFLSAVEEFQCDFGLKVDGKCGPNTQAKLLSVHGS